MTVLMTIQPGPETELLLEDVLSPLLAFGQGPAIETQALVYTGVAGPPGPQGPAGEMTADDKAKLDAITGTNSGDETAASILSKLLTVDGAGSGLDADTLDGLSSAAFAAASHSHTASQISDSTTLGRALLTAADVPAANDALATWAVSLAQPFIAP